MLEEIPDLLPKKSTPAPTSMAIKRLTMDYKNLISDPLPSITAHPLPENILEWHFLILGSENTPYEGVCIYIYGDIIN